MNTVVYRPTSSFLNRVFDDRLFPFPEIESSEAKKYDATDWVPRVDIRSNEQNYVLDADVPGLEAKDIDITLDKNVLTIRGSRPDSDVEGYSRKERFAGNFSRQFTLPETADVDGIAAKTSNGVLTVTIPKIAQIQPRSIEVKSEA